MFNLRKKKKFLKELEQKYNDALGSPKLKKEFLRFVEESSELKSNSAEYFYWKGRIKGKIAFSGKNIDKKILEAIEDLNKSLEFDPNLSKTYSEIGKLYRYLGRFDESINSYTQAIEIEPKNREYYENRARMYIKLEKYNEAIKDFTKLLKLSPSIVKELLTDFWSGPIHLNKNQVYRLRGETKLKLKDSLGALEDFNNALKYDPDDDEAYYQRGLLKIELGQLESGCVDLSKAGELGNEDADDALKKFYKQK